MSNLKLIKMINLKLTTQTKVMDRNPEQENKHSIALAHKISCGLGQDAKLNQLQAGRNNIV